VGLLALSDRYGVYMLIINCGKEIKFEGVRGSVWGGVDQTIEVVEGEELKIT
jgi:hypothetical protein